MPQCIPRLVRAVAIIGLASVPVVALSVPARADTLQSREWWLRALHVVQAWRTGEGAGVTVAVLADGVDARQPDIAGSVVQGRDLTGSGRRPGGPQYGVIGTGLASLIAGHGHGKKVRHGKKAGNGLLGIAPRARILSVRVTLSPGDPLWANSKITSGLPGALAAGIRYAVEHGAQVIALPPDPSMVGLPGWGGAKADAGGSAAERAAIVYARHKNVMLVAPAGDNAQAGDAANYPAAYPGVISVGAFNSTFTKAPFSNRRPYVTVTAAGQGVIAAAPSGYETMNSTWAASAIAAGIAALVRSQFPSLTAAQVKSAITTGTAFHRPGGRSNGSGYGTVDASKAVDTAATMSPPHAVRAMRGALPWLRPVPPRVDSLKSVIVADLIRDGEIAAAAFAALMLAIIGYHSLVRRRDSRTALAMAGGNDGNPRFHPASTRPDPLLEFFGPQHVKPDDRPAGQWPPANPRYQPRPALTGRSTLSGRAAPGGAPAPSGQAAPFGMAVPSGPLAQGDRTGQAGAPEDATTPAMLAAPAEPPGPVPAHAPDPAGRAGPPGGFRWAHHFDSPGPHRPRVTGAPPWGPAPEPTTKLPWAAIPGPSGGTVHRADSAEPTRHAPPESLWNDSAPDQPTARSVFEPVSPPESAEPERAGGQRSETGTGGRPIYVWNPAGSTEPFPKVGDEPRQPGQ